MTRRAPPAATEATVPGTWPARGNAWWTSGPPGRHLGIAAHIAGNLDEARALLEESTALRRTLGFTAGVAANLVGLIYLSDGDDAQALADEAAELAASVGAATISAQIEEARSRL